MRMTVILVHLLAAGFQLAQAQEARLDPKAAIAALSAAREDLPQRGPFAVVAEGFTTAQEATTVAGGLGGVAKASREITSCTKPDQGPRSCSMNNGLVGSVRLSRIVSVRENNITVWVQSAIPIVTEYRTTIHLREYAVELQRGSGGKWIVVNKKLILES